MLFHVQQAIKAIYILIQYIHCMLNIFVNVYISVTVKGIVDFWLLNKRSLESRYHASDFKLKLKYQKSMLLVQAKVLVLRF